MCAKPVDVLLSLDAGISCADIMIPNTPRRLSDAAYVELTLLRVTI